MASSVQTGGHQPRCRSVLSALRDLAVLLRVRGIHDRLVGNNHDREFQSAQPLRSTMAVIGIGPAAQDAAVLPPCPDDVALLLGGPPCQYRPGSPARTG